MICRLCLNKSTIEVLNIFDAEGIRLQIADIISKHFWFSPSKDDPISDKICCSCWTKVNNFHEFYCFVEIAHKNLINITDSSSKVQLHNVKEEHIFTSDSDEDVNNVLDIELTENFEIVFNKQDPIADIKVDEDAKFGITFENNSSKTKIQRKSNLNKQCDNEKNKEQFEENSTTDEETTKNRKNSQSKKFKASQKIQTKSKTAKKIKQENLDSDNDDTVIEDNADVTASRNRSHEKISKQQKRKIKKKLDTDNDDEDSEKLAQKKKIEEENEKIAKYVNMDCDLCKTNFKTFTELKRHFSKEHHNKNGYVKCCNKKLLRRNELLEHVNFHINPDAFICKLCNRRFKNADYLKCHEASQHNADESDLLRCDKCEKRFSKKYLLDKHKLMHAPPEERHFECSICKKGYPSNTKLNAHIRSVHQRLYDLVCDICAKKLSCRKLLEKHRLEHDGIIEPKVQCPICSAWVKKASYLRKHMRLHNELHKCEICGIQSARRDSIMRHIKFVHQDQRDFKCTFCEKAFKRKQALTEHITTHTGDTLYTCTFCPQTFNSNGNMYSHRKKVHPKEWEELNNKRMNPDPETILTSDLQ